MRAALPVNARARSLGNGCGIANSCRFLPSQDKLVAPLGKNWADAWL